MSPGKTGIFTLHCAKIGSLTRARLDGWTRVLIYTLLCNYTTTNTATYKQYQLSKLTNSGINMMTALGQDKEETVEYSNVPTIEG